MNRKLLHLLFALLLTAFSVSAQDTQKSSLHLRAEAADKEGTIAPARSLYIHAFNDYVNRNQVQQGVECATKAAALYYKENYYKEAFDLLRRADQAIIASSNASSSTKAGQHYLVTKERLAMYIKLRKNESAKDQLNTMEAQVSTAANENLRNDLLYNKAIYYYTFGQNAQGNAVFKEMAGKLTANKEYDKVDEVYQQLIANGRRSNSANLVAQSYINYMAWKDSVNAIKHADETAALRQQIADNEASIANKDDSLSSRETIIIALCVLAVALAGALVVGGIVLLRFIYLTRKQKKIINQANENNALKAKFINSISAQLEPTLRKLDSSIPEVKALLDFSNHVETLSTLENDDKPVELTEEPVQPLCESLMDGIRSKVKPDVTLTVNAPKMTAPINHDYVSHILAHLLSNAAEYTPAEGKIWLEYKKRGAHAFQFIVTNTGDVIPEDERENLFKPFREIRDLTTGDGLGLPICRQMALKMNGDLDIDPQFTKGTRFILNLHT